MPFNAVTSNVSHIFVADSAPGGGVHIHTWSGQHTQSLSHGQLGLQDYDWIWAINHTYPDILQLAIGDCSSETVHSLHVCKVSDFQADIALGDYIKLEDSITFFNSFICIYSHNYLTGSCHTSKQAHVVIHCIRF